MTRTVGYLLFAIGLTGLLAGCGEGAPHHAFIWEASGQVQQAADVAFLQERPTLYRTSEKLPDLDVRTLAVVSNQVWAGTATGLFRHQPSADRFERQTLLAGPVTVVDIATQPLSDGRLVLALADGLELFDPSGKAGKLFSAADLLSCTATDGQSVWVGGSQGLGQVQGDQIVPVNLLPAVAIRDLACDDDGILWIACSTGLIRFDGAQAQTYTAADAALPDDDVRALAAYPGGGVLAGCATGAALVGTASDQIIPAAKGALPYHDITSVFALGDFLAFGHGIGATVASRDFAYVDHYHSLRWIPAEAVTAVVLQGDRQRWIATPGGISRIDLSETTLAEKAARFESLVDDFWRLDFVSDSGGLQDPWETSAPLRHWDHDNDGLWTQMQVVAWSYAAAASGDRSFCEKARRAMGAMMDEIDIPAVSFEAIGRERGFVARSFVRDDEGEVFAGKLGQPNWYLVEDYAGHDYYWKNDTSSDETTGHFFGYPVYYDFCATGKERGIIAEHAGALARHIVDHGLMLINLEGNRTSFGHWDPGTYAIALDGLDQCLENYSLEDCGRAAYGGGWLNGTEILGHLLAAYHMTGDKNFYQAYERLIEEERYGKLVDFNQEVFTVTNRNLANHSDHELAFLAYHTLIRYEANPVRRERWIQSMLDMYQYEIKERNPLWSAIIAGVANDGYHLEEALRTLREWPEDFREWRVDNRHRKDATLDVTDRFGDDQFTTLLPYDEIRTMKWNGNPYQVAAGGDGRSVQAPWPWLLPYWIYRYHGIIH